jgi:hypothetical protein
MRSPQSETGGICHDMGVRIGVVHPGNMGAALAECVEGQVFWASEGRSQESAARAREAEIVDLGSLDSMVASVDVIISVCPPVAAVEVAEQVSGLGFDGLYLDVNAVSQLPLVRSAGSFPGSWMEGLLDLLPHHLGRASQHREIRCRPEDTTQVAPASISRAMKLLRWRGYSPGQQSTPKWSEPTQVGHQLSKCPTPLGQRGLLHCSCRSQPWPPQKR